MLTHIIWRHVRPFSLPCVLVRFSTDLPAVLSYVLVPYDLPMRGIPLLFVDEVGCTDWNVSCRIMSNQYPTNSPRLGLTQLCLEHRSDNEVTHIWCRWQPATSGSASDHTWTGTDVSRFMKRIPLHKRVWDDITVALNHESPKTAAPKLLYEFILQYLGWRYVGWQASTNFFWGVGILLLQGQTPAPTYQNTRYHTGWTGK